MTTSSKEFITNFRNARLNPLSSSPTLLTRGDIVKTNRAKRETEQKAQKAEWKVDEAHAKAEREWAKQQIKESAPLREEIKQASGGRVTVDESIYNKTSLQRILNTVQKMQQQNNGALFPGYTVISNAKSFEDIDVSGKALHGPITRPNLGDIQAFPVDEYRGTKNQPYRVLIKDANNPLWNDYIASEQIEAKWWPKTGTKIESPIPTHELSHTVQFETNKKAKAPTPAFTYEEKEKLRNFMNSRPSMKQIFYDATTNTGFKSVQDAAKSVSGYADYKTKTEDDDYFSDLFAEAYTDVLYNGSDAAPYSKELIRLYVDYVNDYNNTFKDWSDNKKFLNLSREDISKMFNNKNNFIENLRNSNSK